MKINRITITGADNNTEISELIWLAKKFPFVEWGILFSASRPGTNRYPSLEWIKELQNSIDESFNLSAHLCGKYLREILQDGEWMFVDALFKGGFKRAQLNFNFSNTDYKPPILLRLLDSYKGRFILQTNKSNFEVIETIKTSYEFDVLYDSSGGRGTEIKEIKPPYEQHYTGYSGGLSPLNIEQFCEKVIDFQNDSSVFIDCESGVRDEKDEFDLDKVEKYLLICEKYVTL